MSDTYNPNDDEAPETLILPLDDWHRARGGRMVEFAGYWMPVQYDAEGGGIMAEHLWTREHAGLFDVSHMGQLLVRVEDADGAPMADQAAAQTALEGLLPADLAALRHGRVRYSLLLGEDGGILDDLMVTRRDDGFYLVVNGATKWDDIGHLRENLPDDITLTHLDEHALLALQGPQAVEALAALVPDVAALGFMQAGAFQWGEVALWISRSGYTGEDGFEISLLADDSAALADALCADPAVRPIGLGARDSLRLEAGLPLYGHDMDEGVDPVTAALDFAISRRRRDTGGFIGADAVLPLIAKGTPTRRVGLALEGRQAAREGAAVLDADGAPIGTVSSGGFGPSCNHAIAMAALPLAQAIPGTAVFIDVRGRKLPATVTTLPFVPHTYHRKGAAQ
ncbi:glycine cleavage system aminomethyltransferase GcvT [Novosphingobium sp. FSY-8]|uniref:aminomethyltransferase n=1 Tax=Novosphingobium ovatum TaxID=1908523 RepID=A0ABW9XB11_9SPHN|nr:glycine cleavage system aminomethyltransferase GcvT [Novosphingobium ovatum]NBC35719.1 glycine cleavage system aminomethyltransferase GcvT [Novosphingobium ovatum]